MMWLYGGSHAHVEADFLKQFPGWTPKQHQQPDQNQLFVRFGRTVANKGVDKSSMIVTLVLEHLNTHP